VAKSEFMIEAVFGHEKRPMPTPITRITAPGRGSRAATPLATLQVEYEDSLARLRQLQRRLRQILDTQLADTVKARLILPDGRSIRVTPGDAPPLRGAHRAAC